MRSWPILALLLLASPAIAGPQDAWTIDARASSLTFTASQIGAFVNGRFPAWTGEIVLDPAAPATARIDIKIETPPVATNKVFGMCPMASTRSRSVASPPLRGSTSSTMISDTRPVTIPMLALGRRVHHLRTISGLDEA